MELLASLKQEGIILIAVSGYRKFTAAFMVESCYLIDPYRTHIHRSYRIHSASNGIMITRTHNRTKLPYTTI